MARTLHQLLSFLWGKKGNFSDVRPADYFLRSSEGDFSKWSMKSNANAINGHLLKGVPRLLDALVAAEGNHRSWWNNFGVYYKSTSALTTVPRRKHTHIKKKGCQSVVLFITGWPDSAFRTSHCEKWSLTCSNSLADPLFSTSISKHRFKKSRNIGDSFSGFWSSGVPLVAIKYKACKMKNKV